MRDASQLESDSVNDYINRISVDTGTSFYSRRGGGRVSRGDRMIETIAVIGWALHVVAPFFWRWVFNQLEEMEE